MNDGIPASHVRTTVLLLIWLVGSIAHGNGCVCSSAGQDGAADALDGAVGDGSDRGSEGADAAGEESEDDAPTDGPPDLPPITLCGNGVLDPGEECDDGNRLEGDGCDWGCRLGNGIPPDPEPDASVPPTGVAHEPAPIEGAEPGDAGSSFGATCPQVPLAWSGSAYATVWVTDNRVDLDPPFVIRFLRFDRDGRKLDSEWTYNEAGAVLHHAVLAWSGAEFGLAWCSSALSEVRMMILDPDGKPRLGPTTVAEDAERCDPRIAWDGDAFVLAWSKFDGGPGLSMARVDPSLDIVESSHEIYRREGDELRCPVLAVSDSSYLVAFVERSASCDREVAWCVRWLAVDRRTGTAALAPLLGVGGFAPDAAWNGDEFGLLAVGRPADLVPGGAYFLRISTAGELVAAPRLLDIGGGDNVSGAGLEWGGGGWFVGIALAGVAAVARTDREGAIVSEGGPFGGLAYTLIPQTTLGVAFDGDGFGVAGIAASGIIFSRWALVP